MLRLVAVRGALYARETAEKLASPGAVASYFRRICKSQDRESVVVFHLDSKNKIVSAEIVAIGTLNAALVHPREVFKAAILANACGIITAHNHPSGDPTPSAEDHELDERLTKAGAILGIPVLDNVVIGRHSYWSRQGTIARRDGAP